MGTFHSVFGMTYREGKRPDYLPGYKDKETFDPQFGFDRPRKEKVMKISEQEMDALKMPLSARDYCAHLLVDHYKCISDRAPFQGSCKTTFHTYSTCRYEEYVMRMKEYEREKRLRLREQRLGGKAAA